MFSKCYNNNTLSTQLPTQKVATCKISSVKTKSTGQTRLSNFSNHFWKVQMDKLRCITNTAHSPVTKVTVMETFFSRVMSDREYQHTEPWLAKIVDKVIKEVQKCNIGSLEALEKHISAKIFEENLHSSVKILQNPAEKILQICTDSGSPIFPSPFQE